MRYGTLLLCVLISVAAAAQTKPKPKTPAKPATKTSTTVNTVVLRNALDSFSYAMGMSVGNFCDQQGITNVNTSMLLKGLGDGSKPDKALLTEQQMSQVISTYLNKRNTEKASKAKAEGKKFLDDNAKKAGVVTLASGLQYQVMKAGTDTARPTATDRVKVHYHGTLLNGFVFDSSVRRGEPTVFALNEVIVGWTEVIQLMTVGSKWKVFLPSDLAYGDRQMGQDIPPGSTLVFEIELLEIVKAPGGQ